MVFFAAMCLRYTGGPTGRASFGSPSSLALTPDADTPASIVRLFPAAVACEAHEIELDDVTFGGILLSDLGHGVYYVCHARCATPGRCRVDTMDVRRDHEMLGKAPGMFGCTREALLVHSHVLLTSVSWDGTSRARSYR